MRLISIACTSVPHRPQYGPKLKCLPGGQVDRRLTAAFVAAWRVLVAQLPPETRPALLPDRLADVSIALFALGELVVGWASAGFDPSSSSSDSDLGVDEFLPARMTVLEELRDMVMASRTVDASKKDEIEFLARTLKHFKANVATWEAEQPPAPAPFTMEDAAQAAAHWWRAGRLNTPSFFGYESPSERDYLASDGALDGGDAGEGGYEVEGGLPFGLDLNHLDELSPRVLDAGETAAVVRGEAAAAAAPSDPRIEQMIKNLEMHKKLILLDVFVRAAVRRDEAASLQRLC